MRNDMGTVTGSGTYAAGASVNVNATAKGGFNFMDWTENNTVVSTSASYTFTIQSNRTLVARFVTMPKVSLSVAPTTIGRTGTATFQVLVSTVNLSQPTVVSYSMEGSAVLGSDYILSGPVGDIVIPAGAPSASVTLQAITPRTTGKIKATMIVHSGSAYKLPKTAKARKKTVTIKSG